MNVEIHLFTVKLSLECKNETNIPFVPSDCPYIKVQVHKRLRVLFLSSQQAFNTKMYVTMQCLTEHTRFFFSTVVLILRCWSLKQLQVNLQQNAILYRNKTTFMT